MQDAGWRTMLRVGASGFDQDRTSPYDLPDPSERDGRAFCAHECLTRELFSIVSPMPERWPGWSQNAAGFFVRAPGISGIAARCLAVFQRRWYNPNTNLKFQMPDHNSDLPASLARTSRNQTG